MRLAPGIVASMVLLVSITWDSCSAETRQLSSSGLDYGSYEILPESDQIQIPFELVEDELRLEAVMNGQPLRMLIDNGSLWDQLLFFGSERVDSLGMKPAGVAEVGGAGEGDSVPADLAFGVEIGLIGLEGQRITFYGQDAIILPYEPGKPNPWSIAEGQFSAQFFKHFVVEFNFDEGLMTLTRPDAFVPADGWRELPIKQRPDGDSWTLPAVVTFHDGRRLELDVTMDLGWDEAFSVTTGEAHLVTPPAGLQKKLLGYGATGSIHGYLGTLPALEIAGHRLENVVTTYASREDGGADEGEFMIGMGALSRFNLVFDYPSNRIFLQMRTTSRTGVFSSSAALVTSSGSMPR